MARFKCKCGAVCKLVEGSAGKRARCKTCQIIFTIPDASDECVILEDLAGSATAVQPVDDGTFAMSAIDNDDLSGGEARKRAPLPPLSADSGLTSAEDRARHADEMVARGRAADTAKPLRSFWEDVLWSFLMFTDPGNMIIMVMVMMMYAMMPLVLAAPFIGLICYILLQGWLLAFWFNVIIETASGEDDLPGLGMTDGVFEDVVLPIVRFVGASIFAGIPIWIDLLLVWKGFLPSQGPDAEGHLYVAMAISGLFWPMALLVTAVGGLGALGRVDLALITIFRTFGAYLLVCVFVLGASFLTQYADDLALQVFGKGSSGLVRVLVTSLLKAYFGVVGMRCLGLYYRHNKGKFAWPWE